MIACPAASAQGGNRWIEPRATLNIAHAWQNWFSGGDRDAPATWRRLIDMCVDGIMTSRSRALEKVLRDHGAPDELLVT